MSRRDMARSVLPLLFFPAAACTGGEGRPDSGHVSVVVQARGAPVPGAQVVFHDPDGEVIADLVADDTGRAAHDDVPRGGMVTVIVGGNDSVLRLRTLSGLVPGDDVAMIFSPPDATGDIAISVTAESSFPGAVSHEVETGCTSAGLAGTSGSLVVNRACRNPEGEVSFLGLAIDDGGAPIAWSFLADVDVSTTFDVTLPAWTAPLHTSTLTVTGLPGTILGGFSTIDVFDDDGFGYETQEDGVAASGGTMTMPLYSVVGIGDRAVMLIALIADAGGSEAGSFIISGTSPEIPDTALTADDFLPAFASVAIDMSDPQRPAITWAEGDPSAYEGVGGALQWTVADETAARWDFGGPGRLVREGSLVFPALPPSAADRLPAGAVLSGNVFAIDFDDALSGELNGFFGSGLDLPSPDLGITHRISFNGAT